MSTCLPRSAHLLLSVLLLSILALPASAQRAPHFDYDEVIERTFEARAGQTLTLDTDLGTVIVRGGSGDEIAVTVIKGANNISRSRADELFDRFRVDFHQSSSGLTVKGDYDGNRSWRGRRGLSVYYEIRVPHTFDVEINTAGGSIHVEDLRGFADLNTSGGSITALDIDGDILLDTSGGSITAENIGGRALLETSGGSIKARNIKGAVDAETSGGSITVEGASGDVRAHTSGGSIRLDEIYGVVEAETSGGSITADVAVQPERPMKLETSGGTISLHLIDGTQADIDARASGGRVRTDLPIAVRGDVSRSSLQGTMNGGGPLLTLRTHGGGIHIYKR